MSKKHIIVGFPGEAIRPLVLGTLTTTRVEEKEIKHFHPILAYGYRDELEGNADLIAAFKAYNNQVRHPIVADLYPLRMFACQHFDEEVPVIWASNPGFDDFETPLGRMKLEELAA